VRRIRAGESPDEFCWGQGLGPSGDWRSMFGKVAGCLLHKAEVIALQWDISENGTQRVDVPEHFYRSLGLDLAACCSMTSRADWCMTRAGPAYASIVALADGQDDLATEAMARAFATLAGAAGELLAKHAEAYSEKAALLLAACPEGAGACRPEDLERLRQQLRG